MKRLSILFLLPAIFLAGCVDIQVKTRLNSDGSGTQYWKFITTALLASDLKKQIESDSFFSKHGKLKDEFKEGDYILTTEVPFDSVDQLKASGRDVQFSKTGFLRSTCAYKEVWNRTLEDPNSIFTKRAQSIVPVTIKVSVVMPGKILDSNADTIDGSTALWNVSLQDFGQGKTLVVRSRSWNIATMIALIMLVTTVAGLSVFFFHPVGKKILGDRFLCPECKSVVPGGSSFCNRCGASLKHSS
jgi:hypothetical protein